MLAIHKNGHTLECSLQVFWRVALNRKWKVNWIKINVRILPVVGFSPNWGIFKNTHVNQVGVFQNKMNHNYHTGLPVTTVYMDTADVLIRRETTSLSDDWFFLQDFAVKTWPQHWPREGERKIRHSVAYLFLKGRITFKGRNNEYKSNSLKKISVHLFLNYPVFMLSHVPELFLTLLIFNFDTAFPFLWQWLCVQYP